MAKELEVHYSTVRDWVNNYTKDGENTFSGSGNFKPEDEKIRKLEKQLADLKEENEISLGRSKETYGKLRRIAIEKKSA